MNLINNKFPCTGCGECCKHIGHIKELKEYDLGFGVCKHLDLSTNQCKIYENRPDICKVDKMFEIEYYKFFTKNEFYLKNASACNMLQEKANIDNSFRVKIF